MDIIDKYKPQSRRHDQLLMIGSDPFAVSIDEIYSPTEARINGKRTILVGTNNYLGLTLDSKCVEAAIEATERHGTGTTGSRIANGTYGLHLDLERKLSHFLGMRKVMLFSTGYQANLGMIAGLAGPQDVILVDADSHASIYDGCKLSGATIVRFRHNDPADLNKRLARLQAKDGGVLVVVEGIYSMIGDAAPLADFVSVTKKHGASLLVDEAHSLGVLGETGRGAVEEAGVADQVDFVVGTFSKSLGAIGGFGASNHPDFDVLRFCARSYMYTASPSPGSIASVSAALRRLKKEPAIRRRLWRNADALRAGLQEAGLDVVSPRSPIVAIRMPDEVTAVRGWHFMMSQGIYANLALPPATPNGMCLLRCSVSAAHTKRQIEAASRRFGRLAEYLSSITASIGTASATADSRPDSQPAADNVRVISGLVSTAQP
ncbi:serine palmitoyltransferase [Defluviicoccus vanus]|uniref:Aminotransferase class I/II-fold pyridoxal phosphate-dependent enzyme n=1 Tax=Defluviicoccus vanus TaxID=111831 RepID=A0A7H1N6E1_9PROT|nr:aminotransferase class I/II-fold pyridoxal phosphate-dependent enzyme [Defluviicoccus vanus]QNT71277.1 aminotransferase class I/II-fold pyridoxal phosphate-dependent enzyme [Defluviicoccus vanus]